MMKRSKTKSALPILRTHSHLYSTIYILWSVRVVVQAYFARQIVYFLALCRMPHAHFGESSFHALR